MRKYTKEMLKPVKPTDENITKLEYGYDYLVQYYGGGWGIYMHCDINYLKRKIKYIILVPGAPDKIKPVEYPASKPDLPGKYVAQISTWKSWEEYTWDGENWSFIDNERTIYCDIDYFIPYRLDENGESVNKDTNTIWNTKTLKIRTVHPGEIEPFRAILIGNGHKCELAVNSGEFTEACKHWLNLQKQDQIVVNKTAKER
jgi:hypothetical protein